ncbi:MAG: transposase [Haloarculaceae archaeon]
MGISSKKALRCNETIAFIDETAFRLTPTFHRTWAPMGETPFVETESSTDPVAVISALTYTPETGDCELYFRSQQDHFDGDSIYSFLRDVADFLPRDVMFILDNLPAHFPAVAQLRDEFAETATEVAVEWLPTYAPELNPTEFVWRESKYVELANYAPKDLDILQRRVGQSLTPKQNHQSFLRSCFDFAELELRK